MTSLFQRVVCVNFSHLCTISLAIHYVEYVFILVGIYQNVESDLFTVLLLTVGFRFHHYHHMFLLKLVILLLCVLPSEK